MPAGLVAMGVQIYMVCSRFPAQLRGGLFWPTCVWPQKGAAALFECNTHASHRLIVL